MGAYLSSPICEKDTVEGTNDRLAFAASSMQGWRMSQEDAHNAILNFDNKTSFFAVYDGHGGAEIALYCSRHLPDFLKQLDSYRQGRLNDALVECFLKFDSLLLEEDVKEILQELADSKDKNDNNNDDDDEQIDEQTHNIISSTNSNQENNHNDELNVEEAQLLKKEAELPIEELLKRYSDDGKHFQSPIINKRITKNPLINDNDDKIKDLQKLKELRDSEETNEDNKIPSNDLDQIKTDVVTQENTPTDDVLDQKIPETTTTANGETSATTESKPSSSEPKTTSRRSRKGVSTDTTTTTKSKSLTHHLLDDNIDELEDDDEEDEDDFELDESDDESSDDENIDDENEEGVEEEVNEDDETEETEEEIDDDDNNEEKKLEPSKAARIKKLMRKSIMAILNQKAKKHKHRDDNQEDGKENQNNDDEDEDDDEGEEEDDDDPDDENETDLGKMLDMSNDPGSSSGCTAVVALLHDKQLFVANAGDSRCVLCHGGRAIEMSIDHKPEDPEERTRIEKAGYKVTLDGRVSGGLNLSRAIGDHAYKKTVSLPAEEQAITALPDIRTMTLDDQDEFMVIACDGIWNFMSSQDVIDFVRIRLEKKGLTQICEELFMHCLAPNTSGDGTGCDNMTAIIVKFNFNQQSTKEINSESIVSKSVEHSPWATMFSSVQKRSLSPEHTSTTETTDNNNSKKLKIISENGINEITSPSKTTETFSFNPVTNNNNNNSNDDDQQL